jgi:hypothetical protein
VCLVVSHTDKLLLKALLILTPVTGVGCRRQGKNLHGMYEVVTVSGRAVMRDMHNFMHHVASMLMNMNTKDTTKGLG